MKYCSLCSLLIAVSVWSYHLNGALKKEYDMQPVDQLAHEENVWGGVTRGLVQVGSGVSFVNKGYRRKFWHFVVDMHPDVLNGPTMYSSISYEFKQDSTLGFQRKDDLSSFNFQSTNANMMLLYTTKWKEKWHL